jgi:crotonobetainyl-CoA:carnitine CoA-transferase CaiB-like acyl-CoA transferase
MPNIAQCLAGIRVLDFTQVQFGPCCTQVLADFGADVIKIERPRIGDISRGLDLMARDSSDSTYFLACNRSKKSVELDMQTEEGRAAALKLALSADVLVHNYRPGVIERMGLGFEALKKVHPRLIFAAGSGFGPSGPLARKAGQDLVAQSLSGAARYNEGADGTPRLYPIAIGDFTAGMLMVQGILLALRHRDSTGEGSELGVSLLDAMLTLQQTEATQMMARGRQLNYLEAELIGVLDTKDGALSLIGVFRPNPLRLVCEAMEMEDLSAREEFATKSLRAKNRRALWALLQEVFGPHTTDECIRRLEAHDVLCAPVLKMDAALAQPQVDANQMIVELEHPSGGSFRTVSNPLRFAGTDLRAGMRRPPRLGEHTAEILGTPQFNIEGASA